MSLDDYINRKDQIPPVYNPEENRSSLEESYLPLVQGLPGIAVAQRRDRPFNTTINRFDPEYWLVDYNALMVATILPVGARSFKVPVQWRTNRDFLGVRWVSKDTLSHQNFTYQEQKDYSNLVLGFRHNPDDPAKFTVTITNSAGVFTYRLAPYVWNNTSKKYECLDKKLGTNKTYPASVYTAGDTTIADADMVEYKGRKDYIFILDFNDLRSGHNFTGQLIDPRKVDMISFDCTEEHHGLGKLAYLAQARSNGDGTSTLELGGVHSTAQLTEGDKLQALWTYYDNAGQVVSRENVWEVISYEGFGTSALTVKVKGTLPGWFIESPAFYGRYLKADCPIAAKDTVKLFSNLTLTGNGRKTVGKRRYTQAANGMGMTSGFDDGYNLSPQRQVKQVVDLGYRDWWTTYIGMSHYFNARTAYQKKTDGSLVLSTQVLDWPVLYAGETQLNGQYYIGRTPQRGIDALQTGATGPWDTNYGGIMAFNGTTQNSAADKAAALVRGSYWWDLEANEPGPALLEAVDAMQGRIPHGIVWCQGDQDAQAIGFPGNRNPVPTVARTRLATLKVFEYFRNLWGATLPIFIQEQAWGWSITDPSQPEIPVGPGTPTNLRARRTAWGDLVLEWQSYKIDPLFLQYKVEIYHPSIADRVIHTETVVGKVDGDYAYFDWPVEKYIPVQLANGLGQNIPTSIKFRVTAVIAGGNLVSKPFADFVPIDNTMVKQLIAVGVNQYTGGWFTGASDPSSTGAKNRIAASAMRVKFANLRAMRLHQVMPLDISWDPGLIVTDWWDNGPGPALLEMTDRINALGLRVNFVTQGNPYETEQLKDLDAGQRATKIATWRQATIDMLAWMRANWDNPLLEMYIQGATSIWEGRTNPVNINAVGTAEMKKAQSRLCLDVPGFLLGSYVPGGEDFTNYVYTGVFKKFYTQQTYHAAAVEMGEAMALHINRAVDDTPEYLNPCVGMNRSFELPYFLAATVLSPTALAALTPNDGYLGQVTEKGNRPDNFGVRTFVKPSAPTEDEVPSSSAGFCSTVPPDWEGGDGSDGEGGGGIPGAGSARFSVSDAIRLRVNDNPIQPFDESDPPTSLPMYTSIERILKADNGPLNYITMFMVDEAGVPLPEDQQPTWSRTGVSGTLLDWAGIVAAGGASLVGMVPGCSALVNAFGSGSVSNGIDTFPVEVVRPKWHSSNSSVNDPTVCLAPGGIGSYPTLTGLTVPGNGVSNWDGTGQTSTDGATTWSPWTGGATLRYTAISHTVNFYSVVEQGDDFEISLSDSPSVVTGTWAVSAGASKRTKHNSVTPEPESCTMFYHTETGSHANIAANRGYVEQWLWVRLKGDTDFMLSGYATNDASMSALYTASN